MSSNQHDATLYAAIRRNDSAAVQRALKRGANANFTSALRCGCPNCRDSYGFSECIYESACPSPLYDASEQGYEKIVRMLLDAGADAHWEWVDTRAEVLTAVTVACKRGHLSIVQMLINHDRDLLEMASRREGWTPLHFASRKGHLEVCRFLLECGCNAHATTNNGKTAMIVAAKRDYFEVVWLLLGAGVDVDASDAYKRTALHYAAMYGNMNVMRELIPQNAKLCLVDGTGKTPLDLALAEGRSGTGAAELLLHMYGNKLSQQEEGRLALHALFRTAEYSFRQYYHPLNPFQVKIQLGTMKWHHLRTLLSSVDAEWLRRRDNRGQLPIHIACRTNAPLEVLTLLVERDLATLRMADDAGELPLHEYWCCCCCSGASACGSSAALQLLINHGGVVTLTTRNQNGELPLHVLLSSFGGASINITNTGPQQQKQQQQQQQQQPPAAWPAVRALLQSFPDAVAMRTSAGDYPFMIAASNTSSTSLTVVYEIVRANPVVVALPRLPQQPRQ